MNIIYNVLLAACTAFYFVEVLELHKGKLSWMNIKPFNCTICMSAWFGLALGLTDGFGVHSLDIMIFSGIAGIVLRTVIYRLYKF